MLPNDPVKITDRALKKLLGQGTSITYGREVVPQDYDPGSTYQNPPARSIPPAPSVESLLAPDQRVRPAPAEPVGGFYNQIMSDLQQWSQPVDLSVPESEDIKQAKARYVVPEIPPDARLSSIVSLGVPSEPPGMFESAIRGLGVGAGSIVDTVGALAQAFGAEKPGKSIREFGQDFIKYALENVPEEVVARWTSGLSALKDPSGFAFTIAQFLPSAVAIGSTSLLGGLAAGAKGAVALGAISGAALNAGDAAAQAIDEVQNSLDALTPEDLMQVPAVARLVQSGVPVEDAKKQVAREAGQIAALIGGAAGAIEGGVSGPVFAMLFANLGKNVGGSVIKRIFKGALAAGVGGAIGEGGADVGAVYAERGVGFDEKYSRALDSAALGGVAGALFGGIAGAGARRPSVTPPSPPPPSQAGQAPSQPQGPQGGPSLSIPPQGRGPTPSQPSGPTPQAGPTPSQPSGPAPQFTRTNQSIRPPGAPAFQTAQTNQALRPPTAPAFQAGPIDESLRALQGEIIPPAQTATEGPTIEGRVDRPTQTYQNLRPFGAPATQEPQTAPTIQDQVDQTGRPIRPAGAPAFSEPRGDVASLLAGVRLPDAIRESVLGRAGAPSAPSAVGTPSVPGATGAPAIPVEQLALPEFDQLALPTAPRPPSAPIQTEPFPVPIFTTSSEPAESLFDKFNIVSFSRDRIRSYEDPLAKNHQHSLPIQHEKISAKEPPPTLKRSVSDFVRKSKATLLEDRVQGRDADTHGERALFELKRNRGTLEFKDLVSKVYNDSSVQSKLFGQMIGFFERYTATYRTPANPSVRLAKRNDAKLQKNVSTWEYTPRGGVVHIDENISLNAFDPVLAHQMVQAVLDYVYRSNIYVLRKGASNEFFNGPFTRLYNLINVTREAALEKNPEFYPTLTSNQAFLKELFSSPKLREALSAIPMKDTPEDQFNSVWQNFLAESVSILREVLGVKPNSDVHSLITQVMESTGLTERASRSRLVDVEGRKPESAGPRGQQAMFLVELTRGTRGFRELVSKVYTDISPESDFFKKTVAFLDKYAKIYDAPTAINIRSVNAGSPELKNSIARWNRSPTGGVIHIERGIPNESFDSALAQQVANMLLDLVYDGSKDTFAPKVPDDGFKARAAKLSFLISDARKLVQEKNPELNLTSDKQFIDALFSDPSLREALDEIPAGENTSAWDEFKNGVLDVLLPVLDIKKGTSAARVLSKALELAGSLYKGEPSGPEPSPGPSSGLTRDQMAWLEGGRPAPAAAEPKAPLVVEGQPDQRGAKTKKTIADLLNEARKRDYFASQTPAAPEKKPVPKARKKAKAPATQETKETKAPATQETKETKAPAIRKTKVPTIQEAKAPAVQETKAPAIQETKAPTAQRTKAQLVLRFDQEAPIPPATQETAPPAPKKKPVPRAKPAAPRKKPVPARTKQPPKPPEVVRGETALIYLKSRGDETTRLDEFTNRVYTEDTKYATYLGKLTATLIKISAATNDALKMPRVKIGNLPQGVLGKYSKATKTIEISPDLPPALFDRVFTHETAHALLDHMESMRALVPNHNMDEVRSITNAIEVARGKLLQVFPGQNIPPSLQNNSEFIAELFANPLLRKQMNMIMESGGDTVWSALRNKVVGLLRKLFRLEKGDPVDDLIYRILDFAGLLNRAIATDEGIVKAQNLANQATKNPDGDEFFRISELLADAFYANPKTAPYAPSVSETTSRVETATRKLALSAMHVWNIVDRYAPILDKYVSNKANNPLRLYNNVNKLKSTVGNQWLNRLSTKGDQWADLTVTKPAETEQMNQLMLDATLWEVHPDLPFNAPENAHLHTMVGGEERWRELNKRWRALPQEHRKFYKDIERELIDVWNEITYLVLNNHLKAQKIKGVVLDKTNPLKSFVNIMNDPATSVVVSSAMRQFYDNNRTLFDRRGPYFPLRRIGDYYVVATTDEMTDLMSKSELEALKLDPHAIILSETPRRGGDYRVRWKYRLVTGYESRIAAKIAAAQIERDNPGKFTEITYHAAKDVILTGKIVPAGVLEAVKASTPSLDPATAAALAKFLVDISPETSVRKLMARRAKIPGATPDMLRAFARYSRAAAYSIAQLRYGGRIVELIDKIHQIAKHIASANPKNNDIAVDLEEVANSLTKRERTNIEGTFSFSNEGISSGRLSFMTFISMLGTPAFWLTNLMQPLLTTIPMVGAKFGAAKTIQALNQAYRDIANPAKQHLTEEAGRLVRGLPPKSKMISVVEHLMGNLSSEEQQLIRAIADRGHIDITMAIEIDRLARFGATKKNIFHLGADWLIAAPHFAEVVNRVVTALTAYRLYKQNNPTLNKKQLIQEATDYAAETVLRTQVDYSAAGRPELLLRPHLKALLMFKNYGLHMYQILWNYIEGALGRNPAIPREESLKALGLMLLVHGLISGLIGAAWEPVWLLAELAARAVGTDAETWLRETLADFAPEAMVDALSGGAAALVGVDMSRVGLHSMLIGSYFQGVDPNDPSGFAKQTILNALGAPAAAVESWLRGAAIIATTGDVMKGMAVGAPVALLRDAVKTYKLATDGLTDSNGNVIIPSDKLPAGAAALRALGFTQVGVSNLQKRRFAATKHANAIRLEKSRIYQEFAYGIYKNDQASLKKAREMLREFNEEYPHDRITYDSLRRAVTDRVRALVDLNDSGLGSDVAKRRANELARAYPVR